MAAEAVDCPFSPGDIVSGVVLETSQSILAQSGKISVDIADETNSKTEATIRGVIPLAHLGDHASIINQTLAARLKAGTSLERLLVVEVDKRGVPLLSLKPLLLLSARPAEQCAMDNGVEGDEKTPTKGQAFIPRGVSDLSPGDLVAGFVSKVETFGVFVRFLGGFTALAPRAMVADRPVEDPTGMFVEGDSVR